MCEGCWHKYGSPRADTPGMHAVQPLLRALYDRHAAGGWAHIVTDDWNIEDEHIVWCLENAMPDGWPLDAWTLADPVLHAMKALTMDERASALALFWGMWE